MLIVLLVHLVQSYAFRQTLFPTNPQAHEKNPRICFLIFFWLCKRFVKRIMIHMDRATKEQQWAGITAKDSLSSAYMWLSKAIMLRCPMAGRFSAPHTYSRTCLQCAMGMIVHGLTNLQCPHRDASNFAPNIEPWWFRNWFTCPSPGLSMQPAASSTTSCGQVKDSWNENQCTLDIQAYLTKISCICFKSQCSKWQNFHQNRILGWNCACNQHGQGNFAQCSASVDMESGWLTGSSCVSSTCTRPIPADGKNIADLPETHQKFKVNIWKAGSALFWALRFTWRDTLSVRCGAAILLQGIAIYHFHLSSAYLCLARDNLCWLKANHLHHFFLCWGARFWTGRCCKLGRLLNLQKAQIAAPSKMGIPAAGWNQFTAVSSNAGRPHEHEWTAWSRSICCFKREAWIFQEKSFKTLFCSTFLENSLTNSYGTRPPVGNSFETLLWLWDALGT